VTSVAFQFKSSASGEPVSDSVELKKAAFEIEVGVAHAWCRARRTLHQITGAFLSADRQVRQDPFLDAARRVVWTKSAGAILTEIDRLLVRSV
jgi:hypothetical protein